MKIKYLIESLKRCDPNREVVLAKDVEGNSFSPLYDIETGSYETENTWSVRFGIEELTDELKELGYTEEDVVKGVPCIVLWPIN